jgi:hypothetical protein
MPMEKRPGTPDAGKPHVRCDEGGDHGPLGARPATLLVVEVAAGATRPGSSAESGVGTVVVETVDTL